MDDTTLMIPTSSELAPMPPDEPRADTDAPESSTKRRRQSTARIAESADTVPCERRDDCPAQTPLTQIVEAILFASDAPLTAARIAEIANCRSSKEVRAAVDELNGRYETANLTFRIEEIAGGYRMLTLPSLHPWLARLNQKRAETRLSDAAMETLAIIAYRQPIMRADIEAVRGVAAGETIGRLRELGLVKVVGRAEIVGRPQLLGTTKKFLDTFGLGSADELPPLETFSLKLQAKPAAEAPTEAPLRAAAGA